MFYLYILYSAAHDKYYVGQSEDPWLRLCHHNNDDKSTYTSKYRPWELKAVYQAGTTRSEAFKVEQWIKKQKSRILIEKLLSSDFIGTDHLAQLVRVPHVRD